MTAAAPASAAGGRWAHASPERDGSPSQEKVFACLRTHGTVYELVETETTIGRGEECDLVLDGRGISRMHAKITFQTEASSSTHHHNSKQRSRIVAMITDLGSSNGTYVNDARLQPMSAHVLLHRDLLRFGQGKQAYWLELPTPSPEPPRKPPAPPPPAASHASAPPERRRQQQQQQQQRQQQW